MSKYTLQTFKGKLIANIFGYETEATSACDLYADAKKSDELWDKAKTKLRVQAMSERRELISNGVVPDTINLIGDDARSIEVIPSTRRKDVEDKLDSVPSAPKDLLTEELEVVLRGDVAHKVLKVLESLGVQTSAEVVIKRRTILVPTFEQVAITALQHKSKDTQSVLDVLLRLEEIGVYSAALEARVKKG